MKAGIALALVAGAGGLALVGGLAWLATSGGPPGACSGGATVVVNVTASRYAFEPGTSTPLAVVRCDTIVLRVTSADVTHGLAIAEYGVQEIIPAGSTVEIRFTADRAGDFVIYCTAFCGPGHPQHKGTLHVA